MKESKWIPSIHYTSFIRHHFVARVFFRSKKCYKANKGDKMAYKTSVIQYFVYFAPILNFKFKKSLQHNTRKIIFGKYKGWWHW
jgi:hypothetical protein